MEARRHLLHTCDVERSVLSLHTHVDTLSDAREGQSWVIGDITVTSVRRGKGSGCAWVTVGGLFGFNVSYRRQICAVRVKRAHLCVGRRRIILTKVLNRTVGQGPERSVWAWAMRGARHSTASGLLSSRKT